MTAPSVFLDTSALLALVHARDALHRRAARVLHDLGENRAPLTTSDWVLAEFLAGASAPTLRGRAGDIAAHLLRDRNATVVAASRAGFAEALKLYRSRNDKAWSLVDCSSMLVCEAKGIRRVFTHDRHFAQAGFEILLHSAGR